MEWFSMNSSQFIIRCKAYRDEGEAETEDLSVDISENRNNGPRLSEEYNESASQTIECMLSSHDG